MAVTYRAPGVILTEREHVVPLDHASPDGPTITVFTREVAAVGGEDRPYLVFLQGGPGFEATRPDRAARRLDQAGPRGLPASCCSTSAGTGRSTPVGDIPGETPEAQAEYLTHFRADSIVRDAELHPAGARGRALERPRPELRRLLRR